MAQAVLRTQSIVEWRAFIVQDTINIAAVDDLPADLERLGAALETYAAQHELTIEASGFLSGEELLEAAASGGFDIVFST